jgi:very-short-patch-repair endonuclease
VRGGYLLDRKHSGLYMRRVQPWKTNRSRALRSSSTSAEDRLWAELRNRQLAGLKFVRQVPIGPYFVDFVCREHQVIVEVDGGTHSTTGEIAYDKARTVRLEKLGFRIFRVHNTDVYENIDGVATTLLAFISAQIDVADNSQLAAQQAAAPHPNPLPVKNGEREQTRD